MSNDLGLYQPGGDLQPYSSPSQPLAPTADNWGIEPDYSTDHQQQYQSNAPQLFGQPLPGATPEQMQHALTEIAAAISSDLLRLGDSPQLVAAAVDWLQQNAGKAPRQERITHRFNLYQYQSDPGTNAWANHMHQHGADQTFIDHTLWLLDQLSERLNGQQVTEGHDQPHAMDGNPTSIDQLSEAQYERVVQLNAQLQLRTMDTLSRKWGRHMVHANIALAQKFLDSLPEADQRHFDQYLQDWTHNLNHAETLEFLYGQAIGAGSLPTSGVGIVQEIAQIESVMGTAAYRKDERMQARYRELVTIRDRGR